VDRCALFVDAGYVLADGAMAVHGTRQRGSVSWDYAGLVKLLTGLSRDRTGLPVLRCYWYEATVEGRPSAEHDTLADLPGVKLRLGRIRPGRREGVGTEMHRDLATLSRNHAISDAVIVSAEEDLAEIVAEVQDLGLRVVIVHITADGAWTISRPLRQECDDIVEVSGAHLRPFVDLIAGAEPAELDEQYSNGSYQARSFETLGYQRRGLANGHGIGMGAVTHQGLPAAALPAPPTIYTTPVVEEYQRAAQPTGSGAMGPDSSSGSMSTGPMSTGPATTDAMGPGPMSPNSAGAGAPAPAPTAPGVTPPPAGPPSRADSPSAGAPQHVGPSPQVGPSAQAGPAHQVDHGAPRALAGEPFVPQGSHALAPGSPGERQEADAARNAHRSQEAPGSGRQGSHASPSMAQPSLPQAPLPSPVPQAPGPGDVPYGHSQGEYRSPEPLGPRSGLPVREASIRDAPGLREGMGREGMAGPGAEAGRSAGPAAARFADLSAPAQPASAHPGMAQQMPPQQMPPQQMPAQSMPGQPMPGQPMPGHQYPPGPPGQFGGSGPAPMPSHQQFQGAHPSQPPPSGYPAPQHEQGPYGGPQSAAHSPVAQPVPQPMTVSLAEAVQAAHAEGFGFGDAVARDAPALWLEAVLARKPRMPSDLEARLLQGSALPIDSLLHDEVRHSLRRGFWDALERSRR